MGVELGFKTLGDSARFGATDCDLWRWLAGQARPALNGSIGYLTRKAPCQYHGWQTRSQHHKSDVDGVAGTFWVKALPDCGYDDDQMQDHHHGQPAVGPEVGCVARANLPFIQQLIRRIRDMPYCTTASTGELRASSTRTSRACLCFPAVRSSCACWSVTTLSCAA